MTAQTWHGAPPMKQRLHGEEGGVCHYCREAMDVESTTIDHIVPRAFGGANAHFNYVGCCRACNAAWGAAVRKCGCRKCELALQRHLQEAARNGGRPAQYLAPGGAIDERPTGWQEALAAIEATLVATEARIEAGSERFEGDTRTAALAGKCKGLRIALGLLRDAGVAA